MNDIQAADSLGERIIAAARMAVAAHLEMDAEKTPAVNGQHQPQLTTDQQPADHAQRNN